MDAESERLYQEALASETVHISTEESRILRIAEMLIAEELQLVRDELEMLRADLNRSFAIQRHELQVFYDDAMRIIKRIEP